MLNTIKLLILSPMKLRIYSLFYTVLGAIIGIPSYTNLITNGDFNNGTTRVTPWTGSVIAIESGRLAITSNVQYQGASMTFVAIAGHKYFYSCILDGNVNNYSLISGDNATIKSLTITGMQTLFNTFVATATSHTIRFADTRTTGFTKFWVDNVNCIDLTALGETETDLAILATKYPFDAKANGGLLKLTAYGRSGVTVPIQSVDIKSGATVISHAKQPVTLEAINTIRDEFCFDNRIGVDRCNEIILQASDVVSMTVTYTNVDYAVINKPSTASCYSNVATRVGELSVDNVESSFWGGNFDNISHVGKVFLGATNAVVWVGFAKGTTLGQAQTALTGKKLTYVLATPITTTYSKTQCEMTANGLVYTKGGSINWADAVYPETKTAWEV